MIIIKIIKWIIRIIVSIISLILFSPILIPVLIIGGVISVIGWAFSDDTTIVEEFKSIFWWVR